MIASRIKNADTFIKVLLLCWWIVNLLQATFTELANDEAYYWIYARELDWGYFDHPPMTALLVWLGDIIGGELGVRLFFTPLQPLYLYIMWKLVRPQEPSTKDALLFFVISAALPIMQLYGFIAVPDAPLMMFSALFLLCLKRFCERDSVWNTLLLGLSMALLAYSKYHGALVVLFSIAANPRLLKNPKLYLSGVVTLLLFAPHLFWQSQHDWASFKYHLSDRNNVFRWNYVTEFLLNLVAVFNPLFFPLYLKGWGKDGKTVVAPIRRALYTLTAGFVIFFTLSSLRGYVQPQWVIVITFGLIMILFGYVREQPALRRYVIRAGWITIILAALVRIEMIFNPIGLKFEIFDNRESYGEIAKIADGRPVIFGGNYAIAAKYIFYTRQPAYSQPSINYRTSQWQYIDADTRFAGREVIIEDNNAPNAVDLPNGRKFGWRQITDFRPSRLSTVEISSSTPLPDEVRCGDTFKIDFCLRNPYDYDLVFSDDSLHLALAWRMGREPAREFPFDFSMTIPARSQKRCSVHFTVPDSLPAGNYRTGFIITGSGVDHWFNSRITHIRVL